MWNILNSTRPRVVFISHMSSKEILREWNENGEFETELQAFIGIAKPYFAHVQQVTRAKLIECFEWIPSRKNV